MTQTFRNSIVIDPDTGSIQIVVQSSTDDFATSTIVSDITFPTNTLTLTVGEAADEADSSVTLVHLPTLRPVASGGYQTYRVERAEPPDLDSLVTYLRANIFTAGGGGSTPTTSMKAINIPITDLTVGSNKAQFHIPAPSSGTITEIQALVQAAANTVLAVTVTLHSDDGTEIGAVGSFDLVDGFYAFTTTITTSALTKGQYFDVEVTAVDGTPSNLIVQVIYTEA